MKTRTRVVILAAGKSTRINCSLPGCAGKGEIAKALLTLGQEPIISRLLRSIRKAQVDSRPVIVVSEKSRDEIRRTVGAQYDYALQRERLGTAHAVSCAEGILRGKADAVMVLYADMPFISPGTIQRIVEIHQRKKPAITMATVTVKNFGDWRRALYTYARVTRIGKDIIGLVEGSDASPAQLLGTEVSPSFFCFEAEWLWKNLSRVGKANIQQERYLPDLIRIAIQQKQKVCTVPVRPIEAVGINTLEELTLAEKLNNKKHKRNGGVG